MRRGITRILKYGTLISTYCLIGSVLLQIYSRFFLDKTPPWTEEASRIFFIYTIAFAAGLAFKNDYYVYLDILFVRMSAKVKRKLLLGINVLTMAMFLIMAVYSVQLIYLGLREKSPTLEIPMAVSFVSMFLLSASIAYFAFLEVRKTYKKNRSECS